MHPTSLSLNPVVGGPSPKPSLKITTTASPAPKVMEAAATCHIQTPSHIWGEELRSPTETPCQEAISEARSFLSGLNSEGLDACLNDWVNGLR